MNPARSKNAAFTLMELIVAIMIIGILIGISIPAVTALTTSSGLNTAARKVANVMELARSEAIAQNTVTRFGVALDWPMDEDENLKKCSIWAWDRKTEEFKQIFNWETMPGSVYFEGKEDVQYIQDSEYAEKNRSTIIGENLFGTALEESEFEVEVDQSTVKVRFIEFKPNGRARIRGSEARKVITVLVNGILNNKELTYTEQEDGNPTNWAQINVDTLTGRTRILRP